jgi:hypothetical protein
VNVRRVFATELHDLDRIPHDVVAADGPEPEGLDPDRPLA